MKTFASISILLISTMGMAQSPTEYAKEKNLSIELIEKSEILKTENPVALELVGANILFRGYSNKVIPAVQNTGGAEIKLTCESCTLEKKESYYIVKPGSERSAKITIHKMENGSAIALRTIEYRVMNLRAPNLELGGVLPGGLVDLTKLDLYCGYPQDHILESNFEITSWELVTKHGTVNSLGSELSKAKEELAKLQNGDAITITARVADSDGKTRKKTASWIVQR